MCPWVPPPRCPARVSPQDVPWDAPWENMLRDGCRFVELELLGSGICIFSDQPKTVPEPPQTIPRRPATTSHASHATTHISTAAMGWENARPDRPPPAPRGAHFPTPWPLWRCVSWRGWRGVWWRVSWGWFGLVRELFWVDFGNVSEG